MDYYEQYAPILIEEAKKQEVDPALVLAIADQETGGTFNPNMTSDAKAKGLMQLMPSVAKSYGLDDKTVFNPELNVKAGVSEIKQNLKLANNDPTLATIYYNRGYGNATNPNKSIPEETIKYQNAIHGEGGKYKKYQTKLAQNDTGNTMDDANNIDYAKYADQVTNQAQTESIAEPDYAKYADQVTSAPIQQAPEEPSLTDKYLSTIGQPVDAALAVGSAFAAPIATGLAGIVGRIEDRNNPDQPDPYAAGGRSEQYMRATQNALSYKPRGEFARGILEILNNVGQAAVGAGNAVEGKAVEASGGAIGTVLPEYGSRVEEIGRDIGDKGLGGTLSEPFLIEGNPASEASIGGFIKGLPTAATMHAGGGESPTMLKQAGTRAGGAAKELLQEGMGAEKLPPEYTPKTNAPLTTAEAYGSPRLQGATEQAAANNPEFAARLQEVYQGTNKELLDPIMRHFEDQRVTQGRVGQRAAEAEGNYTVPDNAPDIDVADVYQSLKDSLKSVSNPDDAAAVQSAINSFERKAVPEEYITELTDRLNDHIKRIKTTGTNSNKANRSDAKFAYSNAVDVLEELKSGSLLQDGSLNTPAKAARKLDGYIDEIAEKASPAVVKELRYIASELKSKASSKYLKTGAKQGAGIYQSIRDIANTKIQNKDLRANLLKLSDSISERVGNAHPPFKQATEAYKQASKKIAQENFFRKAAMASVDVSNLVRGIDQKLNYHNVDLNQLMELASSATSDADKLAAVIGEDSAKYYSGLFEGKNPLFNPMEAEYMNLASDISKSAQDASQVSRVRDLGIKPQSTKGESHLEKAATAGAAALTLKSGGIAGPRVIMAAKELGKVLTGKRGKEVMSLYENALISPEQAKALMQMPNYSYIKAVNNLIINGAKKGIAGGVKAGAATAPVTVQIKNFKDEEKQ